MELIITKRGDNIYYRYGINYGWLCNESGIKNRKRMLYLYRKMKRDAVKCPTCVLNNAFVVCNNNKILIFKCPQQIARELDKLAKG